MYADILFCINLLVNYFLLLATGRFCRRSMRRSRIIFGAALGALYAMILFVSGVPPWLLFVSKLFVCAAMLRIAFAFVSIWQLLREYIVFFMVNFIFAGLMLALWLFFAPNGMVFYNGIVYFDISAVMLVAFTAIAYAFTELFSRLYERRAVQNIVYEVMLYYKQRAVKLTGFLDTGSTLKEPYTGYPVAVCGADALKEILPPQMLRVFKESDDEIRLQGITQLNLDEHIRLVPYTAVGGSGILPAFMPQKFTVTQKNRQSVSYNNVYVAVAPQRLGGGSYDILLSSELLLAQKPYTAAKPQEG
ncbi:MAG: sigma-E processing peptidase SpoIIGA [Hydrogenoanaerobacterium sp.]